MVGNILTIEEIRTAVASVARKYNIPSVFLFGSYAKGTANAESDVDLIIDTTGTQLFGMFALGMVYTDLEAALGKSIDLITTGSLTQKAVMDSDLRFRETVMREKVNIYVAA